MALNTKVIGTGYPVVFLHGLALDMTSMQAWYEPLLSNQPVQRIYIDLPGMGGSPALPLAQANSDDILRLVQRTIHELIGHREYAVVGHSYGGYLTLALAYQDVAVQQIFTTCPAFTAIGDQRILVSRPALVAAPVDYREHPKQAKAYQKMSAVISPTTWQAYQAQILPGIRRCDKSFIHTLQREQSKYYRLSFETALQAASLSQSQTMLLGRSDNQVGFEEQLAFMQRQPHGTVGLFDRAGHNLPLEQPALLAAYFREFLRSFG